MNENEKQVEKKVFLLKKKYIIAAAVSVIVIFIIVLAALSGSSADSISLFYSGAETGAVVVLGDREADFVLSGKSVASVRYSENKECAAVLMSDAASYTLYHTDGKKYSKLESCTNDYVISLDGSKVMFCDSSGGLYIFDVKKNKSVLVDKRVNKFCLSPSGTSAVYTKTVDSVENLYIYSGSKSQQIADGYIPLAVSDDLGYIYVLKSDDSLYMLDKSGNVTSKICSGVSSDKFFFSGDMKDVVFSDGSYTYISHEGKSRVRLIPHKAAPSQTATAEVFCDSGSLSSVYDSLTDIFYYSVDENGTRTLFFIDNSSGRTDVAGNVTEYYFTGKESLVYIDADGKIYRYEKGEATLVISGASDMMCDGSGKYIYYTDPAQDLYVIKKNAPLLLASGVEKMYMTSEDVLLFVMTDGRLYSAENDDAVMLVDENVYGCITGLSSAFYVKNYSSQTGKFELYASDGDADFELINENISSIV